jgi:hypothetical protein
MHSSSFSADDQNAPLLSMTNKVIAWFICGKALIPHHKKTDLGNLSQENRYGLSKKQKQYLTGVWAKA